MFERVVQEKQDLLGRTPVFAEAWRLLDRSKRVERVDGAEELVCTDQSGRFQRTSERKAI